MDDITKMGRKEREKLFRRQEILTAAAQLFSEKGFNNTTLEDIAARAEFGIGTIYNYFQSKEEIFRSIIQSIFDSNLDIVIRTDKSTDSLIAFLKAYTRSLFEYFSNNREALLLMVSYYTSVGERPVNLKVETFTSTHCKMDEIIMKKIKDGIKRKEIRELNPQYIYYYFHSLVFPYITNLVKRQNNLNGIVQNNLDGTMEEHADFILDVLFNGIIKK